MDISPFRLSTARVGVVILTTLVAGGVAASDEIATALESAVAENPRDADLLCRLGRAKLESGDVDGARADFERSLDLAPGHAKTHEYLGCALSRQGAYVEALARLTRALELAPNDRETWESRAFAKRDAGFLRGAIEDLTESAQLEPRRAATWRVRGKLYFDLGEYEPAMADLRTACELDPSDQDDTRLYLWLARAADGDRAGASRALAGYLDDRTNAPAREWHVAVGVFLLGGFDEVELMHLAAQGEDGPEKRTRLCEAHFYTGFVKLIDGASGAATESFRRCVGTGADESEEYASAVAALGRLTKKSIAGATE